MVAFRLITSKLPKQIVKDELSVSVVRRDGQPFQVEVHEREEYASNQDNMFRIVSEKLFPEAIPMATFVKTELGSENSNWYLLEPLENPNIELLEKFAHRIGSFALLKQKVAAKHYNYLPAIIANPLRGGTYAQPIA